MIDAHMHLLFHLHIVHASVVPSRTCIFCKVSTVSLTASSIHPQKYCKMKLIRHISQIAYVKCTLLRWHSHLKIREEIRHPIWMKVSFFHSFFKTSTFLVTSINCTRGDVSNISTNVTWQFRVEILFPKKLLKMCSV